MPIYEYLCGVCRQRFERIQKFSDPLIQSCPGCGQAVERLVSAPAIQFKGSGWYITDYAKKNSPAPSPSAEKKDDGPVTDSPTQQHTSKPTA